MSTNSSGLATAPSLTANGTAGTFSVTAVLIVYSPSLQVFVQTFTLTNTVSVPAFVTAVAGTPQSTTVTTAFPVALSAKVTDSGNNPLAGFTVNFTAPSSGASAALSASSAITNSSGIAAVTAAANVVDGSYNVIASIGSITANFGLTNTGTVANPCDVNLDGVVNVLDAQLMINEALGLAAPANDLNSDGVVNVVDVQIVMNATLNLGCSAGR